MSQDMEPHQLGGLFRWRYHPELLAAEVLAGCVQSLVCCWSLVGLCALLGKTGALQGQAGES